MEKKSVCIIPSGDRSGQANLIHHYSMIGWNVCLPLHGTGNLDWSRISTWPALLTRSTEQREKRNLDIYGFERKGNLVILGRTLWGDMFGEDRFIAEEDNGPLYSDRSISAQLIDFEKTPIKIDAFHTLRAPDNLFKQAIKFQRKYFPKASWITSTIFSDHHRAGEMKFKNVCKMLPANYEDKYRDLNHFDCYPSGFEFDLLNANEPAPAQESGDGRSSQRDGYASFVHNFRQRYPEDYRLIADLNARLKKHGIFIPNYGGNISGQGADTKYSRRGPTGRLPTLSIRAAAQLNRKLKAVVIFKQADYGGGAVWYALMAGTPIITHQKYLDATCAQQVLVHEKNSLIVNTTEEALEAILRLERDPAYYQSLQKGMEETLPAFVNEGYWSKFRAFAERAITPCLP